MGKEEKGVIALDAFQRPVRWILTSSTLSSLGSVRIVTDMIIISPYEARCLLPAIRHSTAVTLHQYAPRQSCTFDSLDKLCLHSIPERAVAIEVPDALRMELNLFQGSSISSRIRSTNDSALFLVWLRLQRMRACMLMSMASSEAEVRRHRRLSGRAR
ncbi:uncharacterized protein N7500_008625 [Penicillium coprophilum]|uniref:uncharacterized protein n=1 Tax=Penicillium coprophilum TaxID=36646 RepID=UPI0023940DDF|nr:uncharacterized protein N7500_008625 [Penicillium coprophilum]KAJ5158974.1 hypothetical protein N7500_008625 [Penicillium coprophilum]